MQSQEDQEQDIEREDLYYYSNDERVIHCTESAYNTERQGKPYASEPALLIENQASSTSYKNSI